MIVRNLFIGMVAVIVLLLDSATQHADADDVDPLQQCQQGIREARDTLKTCSQERQTCLQERQTCLQDRQSCQSDLKVALARIDVLTKGKGSGGGLTSRDAMALVETGLAAIEHADASKVSPAEKRVLADKLGDVHIRAEAASESLKRPGLGGSDAKVK